MKEEWYEIVALCNFYKNILKTNKLKSLKVRNEGRMKNDEGWMKNDERWMKDDEGWKISDEGWWFQAVEGFCFQMNGQTLAIVESF